jgi:ketosteroid isomerase-like protein
MVSSPGELSTPAPTPEATLPPKIAEKIVPKATRVPKKEPTAATARNETPEPVPAKAAEPSAPVPQARKAVEAALKGMENQWQAAIVAHDQATVDSLLANDFAGINPQGKFVKKADIIAQMKNDKDTYQFARNDKVNVHVYGADTAVVTGSVHSKGSSKNGQAFDRTYRYTDTWVQRDGKWQCVASQDSLLTP